LGIRRLTGNFFEIGVGLDVRLIFQNCADSLLFLMAGSHDEIQKFLRGL
jgi:mRNA-degrading endonuclease YafQ of YafQ-DinJ toxin-antitoxin module